MNQGYIKLHRQLQQSEIAHFPPCTRELWIYLLLNAQHEDYKGLHRGQLYFRASDFMDATCWYSGFRRNAYTKDLVTKSLRRLCESNMVATTKATHGTVVSVLNYERFQGLENDEGNNEESTKATRKQPPVININKKIKNERITTHIQGIEILDEPDTVVKLREQLPGADIPYYIRSVKDYCASSGKKYKDYLAAVRTFVRRDEARNQVKRSTHQNTSVKRVDEAVARTNAADALYNTFRLGFLNKRFGMNKWKLREVMGNRELLQEIKVKFERLYPAEAKLMFPDKLA